MSVYKPQAGTIAYKVIEYLKTQPEGTEVATGPLADAIGVDAYGLSAYMDPAVSAGLVSRRLIPERGRMNWWRLGRGEPPAKPAAKSDAVIDGQGKSKLEPKQAVVAVPRFQDAVAQAPGPVSVFAVGKQFEGAVKAENLAPSEPGTLSWVPDVQPVRAEAPPQPEPDDIPDAWISARTGAMVLTGVKPDPEDGSLTLMPDLVQAIVRLAGGAK